MIDGQSRYNLSSPKGTAVSFCGPNCFAKTFAKVYKGEPGDYATAMQKAMHSSASLTLEYDCWYCWRCSLLIGGGPVAGCRFHVEECCPLCSWLATEQASNFHTSLNRHVNGPIPDEALAWVAQLRVPLKVEGHTLAEHCWAVRDEWAEQPF